MKVSDYILDYLVSIRVHHVFLITGGAIAFVVDAFHKRRDISYVCMAHEQAAAMAADAYARMGPGIAATMVTSGPGATNLITGICCSWFDSIPTIHISGQVNTYEQKGSTKVRQVGFQETDIVEVVKPVTKFAAQLDKAENIRYLLEKATYIATSGRPGPVLVDIPMNFQRVEVDPEKLRGFTPPAEKQYSDHSISLKNKVKKTVEYLQQAKRPVLLAGFGIRIAHAEKEMEELVNILQIPLLSTWSALDLFPFNHPLRVGEIGVYGNRGANFAVQNSDLLLSIGARLDTRTTGGKPETFAREAKKIIVDIDQAELSKRRGLTPDLEINSDAKEFLTELLKQIKKSRKLEVTEWKKQCAYWKKTYKTVQVDYFKEKNYVNPYVFSKVLSEELSQKATIIPDDGGHLTWTIQGFEIKKGQRLFSAFGNSPMGYAFPASIGASFALRKSEVICIDGDGSFQMNIQELQTLVHHKLPVKIFILDNHGYGIIKQFQQLYIGSRFEATGKGYSCPDLLEVGKAYGIKTVTIKNHSELRTKIRKILQHKGPVLCDVILKDSQIIIPKLEFGKPIEDMSPLLPREEFMKQMIVKPYGIEKPKGAGV